MNNKKYLFFCLIIFITFPLYSMWWYPWLDLRYSGKLRPRATSLNKFMEIHDELVQLRKPLPELIMRCDYQGRNITFENAHPEINVTQYPALYQFYPELAAFYGQSYANLCGYYAAYFACILNNVYPMETSPVIDSKIIIQRLNTRQAFNLFFNSSELVIRTVRSTMTAIHDLTMDEIWLIIREKNSNAASHTVLLTVTKSELIRYGNNSVIKQFQLKQIPYIIIILGTTLNPENGKVSASREDAIKTINHWVSILIRRTEHGLPEFIIADSGNENRSQDPNFLAVYRQLFLS